MISKILFIGGFFLIKTWAVGFFGFHAGGIIHILLVIAISALLIWLLLNLSVMRHHIHKICSRIDFIKLKK
ncbi:MAG: lmo0937 family membrane protein [Bacteroidales bacterium]|nr:lmo0937 family membrane protein [Bacteroidales bacterium]